MYCVKIVNTPAQTESVFFKMFSSPCTYDDIYDVVGSLGYLVTDGVVINQVSPTCWDITQKSLLVTKGWLFGHSTTEIIKQLFSLEVLPIIVDTSFVKLASRSKSTQTKLIKNNHHKTVSSGVSVSTSTYDEVIDELKLKLQMPNFGLQPN